MITWSELSVGEVIAICIAAFVAVGLLVYLVRRGGRKPAKHGLDEYGDEGQGDGGMPNFTGPGGSGVGDL